MEDDCMRLRLVKCQSLLLCYWQVNPEDCVFDALSMWACKVQFVVCSRRNLVLPESRA